MKEILTLLWLAWYKMFTETHLIIDSRRETKIFLPSYPVVPIPYLPNPTNPLSCTYSISNKQLVNYNGKSIILTRIIIIPRAKPADSECPSRSVEFSISGPGGLPISCKSTFTKCKSPVPKNSRPRERADAVWLIRGMFNSRAVGGSRESKWRHSNLYASVFFEPILKDFIKT